MHQDAIERHVLHAESYFKIWQKEIFSVPVPADPKTRHVTDKFPYH
jgi:hypothetical protein